MKIDILYQNIKTNSFFFIVILTKDNQHRKTT